MFELRMPASHTVPGELETFADPAPIAAPRSLLGSRGSWRVASTGLVLLVALVMLFGGSGASAAARATAPGGGGPGALALPGGLAPLVGSFGVLPTGMVPVAPLSPDASFSFNVHLALGNPAAAQGFLTGLETAGSPVYHQYIPGPVFMARYGPQPGQVDALVAYFHGYGLTAVPADPMRSVWTVQGTVAQAESALHTTLWTFRSGSTLGTAPAAVPALPSSLTPLVESFIGLNAFDAPHPLYKVAPAITSAMITPSVMRGVYNAGSYNGGGSVGLSEMCDPGESTSQYSSDVSSLVSTYSLLPANPTFSGSGVPTCSSGYAGWGIETDLDIQWAHVIAQNAGEDVCLDNTDPSVCDSTWSSGGGPTFGSNSWGGGGPYHTIWSAAKASGVTLLASSGDSGASVQYPAAEPDGLGVGGTTTTPSGSSYGSETVWSGSGGGCDTADAAPSYQTSMTGYPGACSSGNRGDPDVAMDADPNTGVPVVTPSGTQQVGGTSLACPMWAASLNDIYTADSATGFAAPNLYALAESANYGTLFHDITSGSNGYSATTGWDPATGVGSPNIGNLVGGWVSPLAATLTPTSKTVETGQTATLTAAATGGSPAYSYTWQQNGTPIAGAPNAGTYNYIQLHSAPSPYTITVVVKDSKGSTVTAGPASITVTPGPSVTFSASPTTVEAGQQVTVSAVASGGSGTYSYKWQENGTTYTTTSSSSNTWTAPNVTMTPTLGVQVVDSLGGTATSATTVQVYAKAGIGFSVNPAGPIDVNMAATLTAVATGGAPPLTYTFTSNGSSQLYSGAQSTYAWTPTGPGTYQLSASLSDGLGFSATSGGVAFTVNPDPTVLILPPTTSSIDVGQYVTLVAHVNGGTGPFTFAWKVNGAAVTGVTSGSYGFKDMTAETDTITVQVTDSFSQTSASQPLTMTVYPLPTVTIQGSGQVQVGTTDTLTAQVTGGAPSFTYLWTLDQAPVAGQTSASYPFPASTTGTYAISVQIVDAAGNQATAYKTVNVTAAPPFYEQSLIPGTSATVSWGIIIALIVAVIVVLALVASRRKKARNAAAQAPPPGTGYGGLSCPGCGAMASWGASHCPQCGRPLSADASGGAPASVGYAGPPPGGGGYPGPGAPPPGPGTWAPPPPPS